jgi:hypothetical protein
MLTSKDIQTISKSKKDKRRTKFLNDDKLMICALALKFIGPDSQGDIELKTFLCLNKKWKSTLSKQVYKQALIFESDRVKLNKKRVALWKKLLQVDKDKKDYYAFRDKVNSKNHSDRTFEDDGEVYQT